MNKHFENSDVVRSVRRRVENDFSKIDPSPEYTFTDLAVAFHQDAKGYQCTIERSLDRITVGLLMGDLGSESDPIAEYCTVVLSKNIILEFIKEKESQEKAIILCNHKTLGRCICTNKGSSGPLSYEKSWDLFLHNHLFGRVTRGALVTHNSLFILCPDEKKLSLVLSRAEGFKSFLIIMRRLLSLSFLSKQPMPNRSLIIKDKQANQLSKDERLYYFAVSLYFRECLFKFDYGSHA